MSEVADTAHVRLLLADYASVDPQGKLNIIGGGIIITGFNAEGGVTAPFAVVAVAAFDPRFAGESPAVEVLLEQENGDVVTMPGPVGSLGEPQHLRVGASDPLSAPAAPPGMHIPPTAVRLRKQFVLYFAAGLPLAPGHAYTWRVKIDHETRDEWTETMYVPAVGSGPVIG
jgi:hypothetical protein